MAMAPDEMYYCPYEKSHVIRPHKVQSHLMKCRKNHPSLHDKILICPYNYRHHIPEEEFDQHVNQCKQRTDFLMQSLNSTCDRAYCPEESAQKEDISDKRLEEEEHRKYMKKRSDHTKPPNAPRDYTSPREAAIQQQRNLDDLDEWFCA